MPKFRIGDRVQFKNSIHQALIESFDGSMYALKYDHGGVGCAMWEDYELELVTPTGPVRTKTVTEIIPGLYNGVKVNDPAQFPATPNHAHVSMFGYLDTFELRAAAATLLELAGALE